METAIGVFNSRDRAEKALKELLHRDVPKDVYKRQISLFSISVRVRCLRDWAFTALATLRMEHTWSRGRSSI